MSFVDLIIMKSVNEKYCRGGYKLLPTYFEFWQGQTDRIHDRIVFEKGMDETEWSIKRLSP